MRTFPLILCFPLISAQYYQSQSQDDYISSPYQEENEQQHHHNYGEQEHPAASQQASQMVSPSAASCLARIRLAASFDHGISMHINRFIDSMRIDRLRSYVCERTSFFCDEHQQHEVGALFYKYDRAVDIIQQVRQQLSGTEKDQLNMMENLNDTIAEQSFFIYKFHQLNPVDLAVLTAAKGSLTAALSANEPDPELSRAMGTFSQQDLERLESLPTASIPEEVRGHLARCQIKSPDVITNTLSFLLALRQSKLKPIR